MKINLIHINIFFLILLLVGCQSENHDGHANHSHHDELRIDGDKVEDVVSVAPDQETAEMITRVSESVKKINPTNITYYLNNIRAQQFYNEMQNQAGFERINTKIKYALELLNAGKTEESIQTYHSLIEEINSKGSSNLKESILFLKKNLALAYMRKGEQENCLANHTSASCIIPIANEGQHKLKEGSENAIKLFEEILAIYPDDKDCQYLLNIAHMTLGTYPKGVPQKFRINPSYFDQKSSFPVFKDVAMDLGVATSALSGGVCLDDFNGDGYIDIMNSSWGFDDQIRYYENTGQGGFIDKTASTGLNGVTGGLNLRHADYNNDGHMDFIILRGAWFFAEGQIPNSLIRNNGDGTFTDVTQSAGIYSEYPTQTAVWSDFNLDGWLDLFIANESNDQYKVPCELYVSNRDGTFTNQTAETGISYSGFFKGVAHGDINNDGYDELYVSTLGGDNILFVNQSRSAGKLKFGKAGNHVGLSDPFVSFPTWMFDYNNDGMMDIFVSGYSYGKTSASALMLAGINTGGHEYHPYLYRNNGDGTFTNMALEMGITEASTTMGCNFGDLDNDGFLDFYLATGEPSLYSIVPNRMYRNNAGKTFEDVTYSGGFGHIQKGHAVGFGDLDFDGDQDIYAVMGGAFEGDIFQNVLYENPIGNKNSWTTILLEGSTSNRSSIGARIEIVIEENGSLRSVYHTVTSGASFGGNSLLAEIGLGRASKIRSITVIWPNKQRTVSSFENIPVNLHLKITEADQRMIKREISGSKFVQGSGAHQHH